MKIPYHAQVRRADPALASELLEAADTAASRFGARVEWTDESFYLAFDETEGCARLRAAEATRFLESRLRPLSGRLHGWNVILGNASPEESGEGLLSALRRRWHGAEGDGVMLGEESRPLFAGYIEVGEGGSVSFPYAEPALPRDWKGPALAPPTLERFIDETGRHLVGESGARLLLAVGPASAPEDFLEASLAILYREEAPRFLRIHGSTVASTPYGPFLESMASPPSEADLALLSGPDRQALEASGEVASFLRASPFRKDFSEAIRARARLYVAARLRLFARSRRREGRQAVVILEGLGRFSAPSLELVVDLLEDESLAGEGLVPFATASEPPECLPPSLIRIVAAPPPSPAAIAQASGLGAGLAGLPKAAADLAAAAQGDSFRLGLALRSLATIASLPPERLETLELARLAYAGLPPEFAEFTLALALAEETLDDEGLEDFMVAAGFVPGIRPLIIAQLAALGLVADGPRPRLGRAEAALAAAVREGSGEPTAKLKARFSERILAMHARGRLKPSEALFERIGGTSFMPGGRSLFYLDCVAADVLYGPSRGEALPMADPPVDGLPEFLAAQAKADRPASVLALGRIEAQAARGDSEPLVAAVAALARAFDEYAAGQAGPAAARAKPALIALHSLGARRAEARAHRLLGLCALAQTQVQEGADYLANACELAEEARDPFERILSAYAEAGALLVLGDLRRASTRCAKAGEWAKACFRPDWETAAAFLAGRIAFELGRYGEAAEIFGGVRSAARVHLGTAAASRAEIWAGRAAAYSGSTGPAMDLLGRHDDDAEALWFRAELAFFEGRADRAASLSAEALDALRPVSWRPADAISWESGFEPLESRALGFSGQRSYLADQIGAFSAFTSALVDRKPEHILDIALRTREERLATLHPQAHLYHYYCYLALESPDEGASGSVDAATIFSKAFKALQTRTARMDEAGLKNEYLENNRWNRLILDDARRLKLL